ncbi:MAG: CPBP family intramembrane metalloprotease [Cyclobacteriaceae bacterium]
MSIAVKPIPFSKQLINHFYVGVIITLFYIWISPSIIGSGYPGGFVLLIAELIILLPLVVVHFLWVSKETGSDFSTLIPYQAKLSIKSYALWIVGGLLVSVLIYVPLYPVGLFLRESFFSWLPEWYFDPAYGSDDVGLIAKVFLMAILVDGLVGPIAEELFFRGYLLPRMAYLKSWAPVVNGCLFGIYHFWQPHNFIATMALGMVFSYVVWKTKNVYLGIAIHCILNIVGALGGYMAVMNGTMIGR